MAGVDTSSYWTNINHYIKTQCACVCVCTTCLYSVYFRMMPLHATIHIHIYNHIYIYMYNTHIPTITFSQCSRTPRPPKRGFHSFFCSATKNGNATLYIDSLGHQHKCFPPGIHQHWCAKLPTMNVDDVPNGRQKHGFSTCFFEKKYYYYYHYYYIYILIVPKLNTNTSSRLSKISQCFKIDPKDKHDKVGKTIVKHPPNHHK